MIDVPALLRRFEPILYFHKDERFFPSDAKRYAEKSALWSTTTNHPDDKSSWQLRIKRNHVGAAPGEGDVFLGAAPFSGPDLVTEFFFDLASWRDNIDDTAAPEASNDLADLDRIAARYAGADAELAASRFWYHGEVYTPDRLLPLIDNSFLAPRGNPRFAACLRWRDR
jgi:hypothetical protein